jgi:hypothetical protein
VEEIFRKKFTQRHKGREEHEGRGEEGGRNFSQEVHTKTQRKRRARRKREKGFCTLVFFEEQSLDS